MRLLLIKYLVLFLSISSGITSYSQLPVNGLVKDADTDDPVPFANIINMNLNKVCTSDKAGLFKFIPESFSTVLKVSSVGYSLTQISVTLSDTFIVVLLKPYNINLNEVNVYASRSGIQASSLESLISTESYNLAGTTKDIFRSVQMLPGVSSNNAASARYNVRGGTYDENLMLINGIEVAEPYHIKIFPMASVGIFNIDLVQRIDFSAGGFNAEYGDALSSVLNVEYRKANNDSITGHINLGMIDLGLVVEIPFGKKSSLLIGARHSYLDPIVKIVQPEEKISIRYYDIQSKFDYEINTRNKISLMAIYSEDMDKVGPEMSQSTSVRDIIFLNKPIVVSRTEHNNYLLDANYNDILLALTSRHILSGEFIINSEFSYYHERENSPQTENDTIVFVYSTPELFNRIYHFRSEVRNYNIDNYEFKLSGKIRLNQSNNSKTGVYIRRSEFDYNSALITSYHNYNNTGTYPDTVNLVEFPSDVENNSNQVFKANAYKFGGFVTHLLQLNSSFAINMGVRADYFRINRELDFSPRVSLSYNIRPDLKAIAAWGVYYKSPLMKQLKYSYPTSDNTKSQKATHYLAGIEKKRNNITIKVETYYKKYDDLIPLRRTAMSEIIYDIKDNLAEGYATGIDFEYVVTNPKVDVWFNYSLASAKERLKGTKNYYSRYTDQRHTVSSLVLFKMRHNMEFGTKVSYGSGYTFQKKFFNSTTNRWIAYDEIETSSLPYFLSVDLRFTKKFHVFSLPVQLYVDVINCLNRKNSIGHIYKTIDNQPYEENSEFYGVVPTFGIMVDF
ncbi:MAG: TonB-dependent receptor [Bacteroidia bacterium]|nr:TonB-dependent receptor [Bacteroidia bacterium]